MSTIHILPTAAGQTGKFGRPEQKLQSSPTPSDKPRVSDQDMMYAWSIGVTNTARKMGPAPQREEACPPEVYIG